ncbi:hypothetical protein LptCag_1698 [Leptospirillum ferriphilum]|uniref:Uncharacterized protein n=1 Tax=Leptospirillum ferriphilum TaxID=178606 RepID=A0A094X2S1_9BACT|nr:hypothetical protein LptCag_1698 [Leptospirillum ferriphilum]
MADSRTAPERERKEHSGSRYAEFQKRPFCPVRFSGGHKNLWTHVSRKPGPSGQNGYRGPEPTNAVLMD